MIPPGDMRDDKARKAAIKSLQLFYRELDQRYNGQYPNEARASLCAVNMAVSVPTEHNHASLLSKGGPPGTRRSRLGEGRRR